jgi:membrane protease YdiL (CAAX protease family)
MDPRHLSESESTSDIAKNHRGSWIIFLALMVAYILAAAWRGASTRAGAPALSSSIPGLLADTSVGLLTFMIPFGIGLLLTRPTKKDFFIESTSNWFINCALGMAWSVVLRLAIVLPAAIVAGVVISLNPKDGVRQFAASRPKIENLLDLGALADPAYAIICITWLSFVVAGLREELWRAAVIRGVSSLAPNGNPTRGMEWVGVLLSSVLFGFAHVTQGWLGVLLTGLLGFGLGMIQIIRRSLPEAVLAHGFFDASTFLLIFLLQQKNLLLRLGITPELMNQIMPR